MTLEEDSKKSRRSVLKGIASSVVSGALTSPFSAISGAPLGALLPSLRNDLFGVDKEAIDRVLAHGNVKVRSKSENFLNIGVLHMKEIIDTQLESKFLGKAVQDSDIVLLESPLGEYFGTLEKHAKKLGKKVINIDRAHGELFDGATIFASFWATARAVKQLGKNFIAAGLSPEQKTEVRKEYVEYVLKTLGISELGTFSPTLLGSVTAARLGDVENTTGIYDLKYDVSAVGDGRTVFMVLDILKVQKNNPGKKIVVITGDGHATGINYYMNDAKGQLEFKSVLYNIIYGWLKYLPF